MCAALYCNEEVGRHIGEAMSQTTWVAEVQVCPLHLQPLVGCKWERAPLLSLARRAAVPVGMALLGSVCVEENNIFTGVWQREAKRVG